MVPRFPFVLPLLLLLASPVQGAIRSTPERELTARQPDLAPYSQGDARIASDGASFLAVWSDAGRILGARLTPDGAAPDPTPFVVSDAAARPAIAWGTDRYFALWQGDQNTIRGRFIAPDGTMSDIVDIARAGTPLSVYGRFLVAFNGRVFLVLWYDQALAGAIVGLDGRVLATRVLPTELARTFYAVDLVAMDGTFYLATAADGRIVLFPIDEQLEAGAPIALGPVSAVTSIHAATRGDEIVVGWTESLSGPRRRIRSAHFTHGAVVDGVTIEDEILHLMDTTADYLLYTDYKRILARPHGSSASIEVGAPAGATLLEDSASNGRRTVAAISHRGDLYTTIVGEDQAVPLTLAPRHQELPDIAAAGELTLAAWVEHRNLAQRLIVVAARTDANGNPLGQPIEIGGSLPPSSRPRVASNGSEWLVSWRESSKVLGVRVARDGTRIDTAPIVIADQAFTNELAVGWDGTAWVAAFTRGFYQHALNTFVCVARLSAEGVPEPAVAVSNTGWNWQPAVASGPEGTLVVWSESDTLRGAMLLRNGVVMPVAFKRQGARPAVAWNGQTFLVAAAIEFGPRELRWLRVDANGNVRESLTSIALDRGPQAGGAVSFDLEPLGSELLLVWKDAEPYISAAVLDGQGNLIDGPARAGTAMPDRTTSLAAAGTRLAVSHPIGHPSRFASRVFTQTLEWNPERRRRAVR